MKRRENRVRRKYGPVGRVFPKDSINSKVFVTRNIIHEKENARSELSDLQHHKIINKRNNWFRENTLLAIMQRIYKNVWRKCVDLLQVREEHKVLIERKESLEWWNTWERIVRNTLEVSFHTMLYMFWGLVTRGTKYKFVIFIFYLFIFISFCGF